MGFKKWHDSMAYVFVDMLPRKSNIDNGENNNFEDVFGIETCIFSLPC